MSLRSQINLRILGVFVCILFIGGSISVWQARKAVDKEVNSSIHLSLQLIKFGLEPTKINIEDWRFRFKKLQSMRHLTIQLKKPSGVLIPIIEQPQKKYHLKIAPDWFIYLAVSEYPSVEYEIKTLNKAILTLIIQANPMDEVAEVWHETLIFFSTLLLLMLLLFLSIHWVFTKSLSDIRSIVAHLKQIELGDYHQKCLFFSTQEYHDIALAIHHMSDVLAQTQQQNRALTQHSLKIQEDERRRLSQELHDEFAQSLTAIKVMAIAAAHEKSDTKMITQSISGICDDLIKSLRSIMKQLHPLILTELGLKAALEELVLHWASRFPKIVFKLQCDHEVDKMNKAISIQVFRVIQESLTNIIRHANANRVTITLRIMLSNNKLYFDVKDDGRGCDLKKVASGFGLLGMEERIKLLEGDFILKAHVNKGMSIKAKIPL
ncbi:MAG: sensor histidine kinase [Methylococcales bacterium]|nr:sensor histidine kinase [Methylococcales bacterium]